MEKPTISEYEGYPYIQLPLDDKGNKNLRFGVRKAKAIIERIEDIKQFVKDYEGKNGN